MARWTFTNPATGATYPFPVNPSEEEEFGKRRNIEHSAPTSGVGLIRQQGDDDPLVLKVKGTIFHRDQVVQMIAWQQLTRTQTIYLTDHAGDQYEILITAFLPQRQRTIRNPRDYANAPLWFWKYSLEMEVLRVISGVWAGVTP